MRGLGLVCTLMVLCGLAGAAAAGPICSVPASVVFAPGAVGVGRNANLVVTNTGNAPLNIASMSTGVDISFTDHGCAGSTCNNPGVIAAGASSTFVLTCAPQAAGLRGATMTIVSDDPTMRTAYLKCVGNNLSFGADRVGPPATAQQALEVANLRTSALTYTVTSSAPAEFVVICPAPGCANRTLQAVNLEILQVTFQAAAAGPRTATLTFTTTDPDNNGTIINVTGTGTEPSIAVAPSPLAFGDIPVAQATGATVPGTMTNTGLAALVISSMTITNDASNEFSFANGVGCTNGHVCNDTITVNAGANQNVIVRCDPTSAGDKVANLSIVSDAPTSPTILPLTCTGTVPDVTVGTMMLAFGNQAVATTSVAQTFTVANSAAAHTAPLAYAVSEGSSHYAITCTGGANCMGTLAAGASITVSVTFTPTTTGAQMANVTIATPTDPDEPTTLVLLTGTGTVPAVAVDAPAVQPLVFDVDVNASSAPGTITLRNGGTSDLTISAVTLAGVDASQFAIATGATGAQVLSSAVGLNTRSWTVTCHPTSMGVKTATFRVTHDAPVVGTQTSISLACTGRAAIFTPSIVAPAKLDFGRVQQSTDSITRTFTFTNTGNKAGRITMLTSTDNQFSATAPGVNVDVAPGGIMTVSAVFHPTTTLVTNAQLCGLNTGLVSPACVLVVGDGESVGMDVQPGMLDFGAVRFDAAAVSSGLVTITNTGESALRIDMITSNGAPLTIINAPSPLPTLTANQTATFRVRLTPTMALGPVMRIVTVNATFTVSSTAVVAMVAVQARIVAPQVSMTADSMDFGMVDVDDAAVERTVLITNVSDMATGSSLRVGAAMLTAPPDFTIVAPVNPVIVPPGMSTPLTVRFDPSAARMQGGTITLGIDALTGMTYTVTLTGRGIDQNVVCNPGAIMFPETVRREASTSIPATVTNLDFAAGAGTAAMVDYTATITGIDAADFSLSAGAATGVITGNGMKLLPITFTPQVAGGDRTAALVVSYSDGGARSCTVALTGAGRLRQITAAPAMIDFGTVSVGSTVRLSEVASLLQLTSNEPAGATVATVTRIATSGSGASAFDVLGGDTATPLQAGGRLEYDVAFSPGAAGQFDADLDVFFDDDPDAQYTFRVTGRAVEAPGRTNPYSCSTSGAAGPWPLVLALWLLRRRRREA